MTGTEPAIAIGWPQLLLATGFVIFVGILSLRLSLGITRDLAIATLRTYVQLIALGFRWVSRRGSCSSVCCSLARRCSCSTSPMPRSMTRVRLRCERRLLASP